MLVVVPVVPVVVVVVVVVVVIRNVAVRGGNLKDKEATYPRRALRTREGRY